MKFQTVDLCDKYKGSIQVALPLFRIYGKIETFNGRIQTVKCYEDNAIVRETLSRPGRGKVLVVDAGGSLRCALVGDIIAGVDFVPGLYLYADIDGIVVSEKRLRILGRSS